MIKTQSKDGLWLYALWNTGSYGEYWSRQGYVSSQVLLVRHLDVNKDKTEPSSYNARHYGFSLRCLAI